MAPKKSESVLISDFDKYLIGQGTHERTYEKLGAHLTELDGKQESTLRFGLLTPGRLVS